MNYFYNKYLYLQTPKLTINDQFMFTSQQVAQDIFTLEDTQDFKLSTVDLFATKSHQMLCTRL